MLQHHIRHEAIYVDRPADAGRYSNQRCTHLQRTLNERPANAGNGILHGALSLQERRTYFFFASAWEDCCKLPRLIFNHAAGKRLQAL